MMLELDLRPGPGPYICIMVLDLGPGHVLGPGHCTLIWTLDLELSHGFELEL